MIMIVDYKKKYFRLVKILRISESKLSGDRCPVFHQCCNGCKRIKDILDDEDKDDRFRSDFEKF